MSILSSIGDALGFGGGASSQQQYKVDPTAYQELYNQAIQELYAGGRQGAMGQMADQIEQKALQQLGQLDNNSAARKSLFAKDMANSFANNAQSMARARGGTGTLSSLSRPNSQMLDAQGKALEQGYQGLNDQALQDLGSLQNIQGNLYNQDWQKAQAIANTRMNELSQRRGYGASNQQMLSNADQAQMGRLGGTIGGIAGFAGGKIFK